MENIDALQEQYKNFKEQYERLSKQTENAYLEMDNCQSKINKIKYESFKELNQFRIGKYYYHTDKEEDRIVHRYIFIKDINTSNGYPYFLTNLIEYVIVDGDICTFQYLEKYPILMTELENCVETTNKEFSDFLIYCHERKH